VQRVRNKFWAKAECGKERARRQMYRQRSATGAGRIQDAKRLEDSKRISNRSFGKPN